MVTRMSLQYNRTGIFRTRVRHQGCASTEKGMTTWVHRKKVAIYKPRTETSREKYSAMKLFLSFQPVR